MATEIDLEIDQDADWAGVFTYLEEDGSPVDVTGWTALLQLRTAPGSIVVVELTDSSGITVGTTDGTFGVDMTHDQTALLTQDCRYDLLAIDGGGGRSFVAAGSAAVRLAISVPS